LHSSILSSSFCLGMSNPSPMKGNPLSFNNNQGNKDIIKPDILAPFLPAADPLYSVRAPVGEHEFILQRSGGPTEAELSNENIIKIVQMQCSDLEVST
jgi:hypothetical protein